MTHFLNLLKYTVGIKQSATPNFGYPVFTKRRPSSGIDFLGKYRVTKVGVLPTVWFQLYLNCNKIIFGPFMYMVSDKNIVGS